MHAGGLRSVECLLAGQTIVARPRPNASGALCLREQVFYPLLPLHMARMLATVHINGTPYFIDDRIHELRNVNDPMDLYRFETDGDMLVFSANTPTGTRSVQASRSNSFPPRQWLCPALHHAEREPAFYFRFPSP